MARQVLFQKDDSIDLGAVNMAFVVPVRGIDELSVQVSLVEGAWSSGAILSVEASLDGNSWFDMPAGAVTISGVGLTDAIGVTAIQYIRVRVSTQGASTGRKVFVVVYGESIYG